MTQDASHDHGNQHDHEVQPDHQHAHSHGHGHGHGHGQDGPAESDMADLLDLDAEVLGDFLSEISDWAAALAPETTHRIVDLGAGTGTGTLALARHFPMAEVIAVDQSPFMLDRLSAVARENGLADRIRPLEADLDAAWPELRDADVVWAALSMHHFAGPDRVLRDIHSALNPGGLLAVVEMDAFPRFLPDDIGIGRPGLEERCRAALGDTNWSTNLDWRPNLERAGFEVEDERTFTITSIPATPNLGRYAQASLSRVRANLDGRLDADDLAILDRLLAEDGAESVLHRTDLVVRGSRTAWAARRL